MVVLLAAEEVLEDEQVVDVLVDDHEVDVCEKRQKASKKRQKSVRSVGGLCCAVAELCCRRAVLSPSCAVADVSACSAVAAVWAS